MNLLEMRSVKFVDPIWSLVVDAENAVLGLQFRDQTQKRASFCTLALNSGMTTPIFTIEDSWWSEIKAISGIHVQIGKYLDKKLPILGDLMCFDSSNGAQIDDPCDWKKPEGVLLFPSYVANSDSELKPPLHSESFVSEAKWHQNLTRAWHGDGDRGIELWLEVEKCGQLLFRTCLETEMAKLHPEPFFIAGEWLIFIRQQNAVYWLQLQAN